jgi:hypothetical protein
MYKLLSAREDSNYMELSHSWEANGCLVKKPQNFIEPEGSFLSSQEPTTEPYPEPD